MVYSPQTLRYEIEFRISTIPDCLTRRSYSMLRRDSITRAVAVFNRRTETPVQLNVDDSVCSKSNSGNPDVVSQVKQARWSIPEKMAILDKDF